MSPGSVVITDVTLIDGLGEEPLAPATVVVDNGRIAAVGATGSVPVPDGSTLVDGTGRWLMPGILNGNVHLLDAWAFMMGPGTIEYLARHEGAFVEVIEEAAQVALRNGVTTVFDTYNALDPVLAARDRIASGAVPGARIFCGGNIVGLGGPFSADFHHHGRHTASTTFVNRMDAMFEAGVGHQLTVLPHDEVRARIRDYLATGVDFLKVAVSDHAMMLVGADRGYQVFSRRTLAAMFDEARDAGVPILTHTLNVESLHTAVELDADILIHASVTAQVPIPQDIIDAIVSKGTWCEIQTVNDDYQQVLDANLDGMMFFGGYTHAENERRLIGAGARIIMGTDAGCSSHDVIADLPANERDDRPWTLGNDHFHWLQGIVDRGMTPLQAISAATIDVARAYRKGDTLGSIEVGKAGDLLLLDADPLADIRNVRSISAIYQDGTLVDRGALPVTPRVTA